MSLGGIVVIECHKPKMRKKIENNNLIEIA